MFVPFPDPYSVFMGRTGKVWMLLGLQTGADIEDPPKAIVSSLENGKLQVVELDDIRICPEEFDLEEEGEEPEEGGGEEEERASRED